MTKVKWSGKTSSYHHKWNDTPNPPDTLSGFRKVWFLDAQWSDCPIEVETEVKKLWKDYSLGNDNFILKSDVQDLMEDYPVILQYVKEKEPDIKDDEKIIIHWWW